jgi:hypothetical protein
MSAGGTKRTHSITALMSVPVVSELGGLVLAHCAAEAIEGRHMAGDQLGGQHAFQLGFRIDAN